MKPLLWENTVKLPIEDVYTRLKIVSRRKTDFRLESKEVGMYDIFVAPDDVTALVEGSPGIGKTTFCLKIAYDWANEKISKEHSFPEFQIVLLLKCRDIDGDILEAINEQLLPNDEKFRKELMDYIKEFHYEGKVLIILDGLDELPEKSKFNVHKLIDKQVLPFCYVLATSRQEKGIAVRQSIDFDNLFQIEGFTEQDAFEYIRKHFTHLGPDHLSKGEKLIQAIQENSFLHALPNNPLNLLLLCVVFEDHEGNLPSGRTELYQIIVRCLLRRFCATHGLEVPKDDKALETKFEESLLALGELAWICLLEDRLSFREGELARFERIYKDLVARTLGLVYKEASLKKIKPEHEYHFFHKTFQEYLAAAYLALKLLREETDVFSDFQLQFYEHVAVKYRQVFLFVSGILGEEAIILFRQIGERLKREKWDWGECGEAEATFLTESFSESRNAEQMATALCSFIPFPRSVDIILPSDYSFEGFFMVAKGCRSFSQLQHPVKLTYTSESVFDETAAEKSVLDYLASCPQVETFSFSTLEFTETLANDLCNSLCTNSTLLSFTYRTLWSISSDVVIILGNGLAACKTLETVTFELIGELGEAWAIALETALSADTPLKSVVLKIYGSMSDTAIQALKRVLVNKFLTSLVVIICGEMQDSLANAVGGGLVEQTVLKTFTLIVHGRLSQSGASALERGFLQNSSLDSLEVKVFGELPGSWATVVKSVLSSKKPIQSFTFHPNTEGNITDAKISCLCPVFPKSGLNSEQSVNLWGELSCNGAETLGRLLRDSSPSRLTVNIHGRVTDHVASSLTSDLNLHKTASFLTFNISGEHTTGGKTAFERLSSSSNVNVHDLTPDYCSDGLDFCIDDPSSLTSVFTTVKNTGTSKLSLTVNGTSGRWMQGVGHILANNTSLTTFTLIVNNCSDMIGDWKQGLGHCLANNTSLTTFTLTVSNCSVMIGDWTQGLVHGLANNTSLTTFTLTVNSDSDMIGDWMLGLGHGLANNTSLTTFTLTVSNRSDMIGDWTQGLGHGLANNTSLTTFTLTVNIDSDMIGDWTQGLGHGLANNTSLTTFTLTVNNCSDRIGDLVQGLGHGLANNMSLTTFTLTVSNCSDMIGDWTQGLGHGLANNTSLTTFTLTVNNCSDMIGDWMQGLGHGLANNTSLTTFTLTVTDRSDMIGDWTQILGHGLANNTSLTTFTLTVNNCSDMSVDWMQGLGHGLANNTSLTTFTLTVSSCSDMIGDWTRGLGHGLANNTSLTTFTLTVSNYSDMIRYLTRGLGHGLANNTSLTTFTLTVNNYSDRIGDWMLDLGDGLANNTLLTTFTFTINNYTNMRLDSMRELGRLLTKCKSLTTLSLTIYSCSEVNGDLLRNLCDSLAKSETLTTLRLTINDHSDTSKGLGFDVSKCFVDCKSLTSLSLTESVYGEASVC